MTATCNHAQLKISLPRLFERIAIADVEGAEMFACFQNVYIAIRHHTIDVKNEGFYIFK